MGKKSMAPPLPDYNGRYTNMLPTDPKTFELWEKARRRLPEGVAFQLMHDFEPATGEHLVSLVLDAKDGKRVRFSEPVQDFPSDVLITQIMLVT